MLDDPRPAQDLARPTHEELEQRELLCSELDRDLATCYPPRGRIKSEVPGPQNRRPLSGAAADEGSQTGQELAERERLRQVVVGTRIESCHTIGDRCAGRQHEDGRPVAAGAYLPAYLEAVDVGQHHVEDDGVVGVFGCGPDAVLAGSVEVDRVALLLQPTLQETGHLHLVLDDQDPHDRLLLRSLEEVSGVK